MRNVFAALLAATLILGLSPFTAEAGTVGKAKVTLNGTTYQTICTSTEPASSVKLKTSATWTTSGPSATITVKINGTQRTLISGGVLVTAGDVVNGDVTIDGVFCDSSIT